MYFDRYLFINFKTRSLSMLKVQLDNFSVHGDKKDSIYFFLRRRKGKQQIMLQIENYFKKKEDLTQMSEVFNVIFHTSIAFSEKSYFKTNFFWHQSNFFSVQDIKEMLAKTFLQITKDDKKLYQNYFLDLTNMIFFHFYTNSKYENLHGFLLRQFLKLNLQLRKLYLIYEGVTSGIIKKDLFMGYLLSEIGSTHKLYHLLNIPNFAQEEEVFNLVGKSHNKVILAMGLEILKKEYSKNKMTAIVLLGMIRDYHLKNYLIEEFLHFVLEIGVKLTIETQRDILDICKTSFSNLSQPEAEKYLKRLGKK